ncbi:MAG TPA: KTSC domain-containing protein [Rhizomicrobium sp.]|jgi:hypothetical protein|nr:KTSC domain-containing protein [Rhizomicrobium sp.]
MPSSVVRRFDYDDTKHELVIVFQTGRTYRYESVPADIYRGLRMSSSKGEFFNRCIRDRFAFKHVTASEMSAPSKS